MKGIKIISIIFCVFISKYSLSQKAGLDLSASYSFLAKSKSLPIGLSNVDVVKLNNINIYEKKYQNIGFFPSQGISFCLQQRICFLKKNAEKFGLGTFIQLSQFGYPDRLGPTSKQIDARIGISQDINLNKSFTLSLKGGFSLFQGNFLTVYNGKIVDTSVYINDPELLDKDGKVVKCNPTYAALSTTGGLFSGGYLSPSLEIKFRWSSIRINPFYLSFGFATAIHKYNLSHQKLLISGYSDPKNSRNGVSQAYEFIPITSGRISLEDKNIFEKKTYIPVYFNFTIGVNVNQKLRN